MADNLVQKLFQRSDLVGLFDWFADNPSELLSLRIRMVDGKYENGRVVQITSSYVAISSNDPNDDDSFTGIIIPLSAISSIEFTMMPKK